MTEEEPKNHNGKEKLEELEERARNLLIVFKTLQEDVLRFEKLWINASDKDKCDPYIHKKYKRHTKRVRELISYLKASFSKEVKREIKRTIGNLEREIKNGSITREYLEEVFDEYDNWKETYKILISMNSYSDKK